MLLTAAAASLGGRHRPPRLRTAAWIIGAAAMLAAAAGMIAAAGNPAPVTEKIELGPYPAPPIYRLLYAWSETGARVEKAQQQLIAACMARHGLAYDPPPPAAPAAAAAAMPRPFGLETLDPPAPAAPTATPANPTGPRYAAVLLGDPRRRVTARAAGITVSAPATGCIAEAETRLLGAGRVRWMQLRILLFQAEHAALRALDSDPTYQALNARWRHCMQATGYQPPDPAALRHAIPARHDLHGDPVLQADLRCKADTHYLPTAYGRLAALQQRQLADDPSLLRDWTTLRARQFAIAEAATHLAKTR